MTRMPSTDALPTRWRRLLAEGASGKQEVDAHHPLRLLFGADDYNRPVFVVMTKTKPTEPDLSSEVVETAITVRLDGNFLLHLALKDHNLFDVFAQLCEDLARRSADAGSEAGALKAVYSALAEWKHLLQARPEHLSLETLRGLVGELWFGAEVLARSRGLADVFRCWRGPYGAHQDFQFADGCLFEVKSVRPGVDWVKIASEHQLDTLGKRLVLAVIRLDDVGPAEPDAITLAAQIRVIRGRLVTDPSAAQAFDTALRQFADPFAHPFYSDHAFRVLDSDQHLVSEGFPSLTPGTIPDGVTHVEYRVALKEAQRFRKSD
jgi:hypothetical protein